MPVSTHLFLVIDHQPSAGPPLTQKSFPHFRLPEKYKISLLHEAVFPILDLYQPWFLSRNSESGCFMKKRMALIFLYGKSNRHSFNALAGALETDGYFADLSVFFIKTKSDLITRLPEIIGKYEKVILGISFATIQLWDIKQLIDKIREIFGDTLLCIAGGPHPTGDPEGTLAMGFDLAVRGEGEEVLPEILKAIDENRDPRRLKGVAFINEQGECVFNGWRPPLDLDKFLPFSIKYDCFGPLEITRGCPFACHFCQTSHIFPGGARHRSIGKILESAQIMKKSSCSYIRFITPNAFSYGSHDGKQLNLEVLRELFEKLRGLMGSGGRIFIGTFPSEVRPEYVSKETLNLVLKYADNNNLVIGAQSGSQRVLDFCRRGHTVEDIYRAVHLTLEAGLKANVDFIFGLPGETMQDIEKTVELMNRLMAMGARIHAHAFVPLPQTLFAKMKPGRIEKGMEAASGKWPGVIYGNWQEQMAMSKKISEYLRNYPHNRAV